VAYVELLRQHLSRHWPDHRCEPLVWTLADRPREHPDFRVLELAPAGRDKPWIYVSAGTAQARLPAVRLAHDAPNARLLSAPFMAHVALAAQPAEDARLLAVRAGHHEPL